MQLILLVLCRKKDAPRTILLVKFFLVDSKTKWYSSNTEAVLDRLPTAKVIKQTEEWSLIEAEVYGKGIVMWLLSQSSKVEVIKPVSLREEIKQEIKAMMDRY